jgi:hypothetical protein
MVVLQFGMCGSSVSGGPVGPADGASVLVGSVERSGLARLLVVGRAWAAASPACSWKR